MSEETKFLEENVLDRPLVPVVEQETTPEAEDDKGEDEDLEEPKRRRERRLVDRLNAEREANIAMAARLEALAEAAKTSEANDYLKKVERIYGTDTPEAQAATALLAEALKGVEERATERAYERIAEERERERQEEKKLSSFIEDIEDTYSVSFTPEMEKSYFRLLEKLSPKDSKGNIIEYADPHTTYEIFKERTSKNPTEQKHLAARASAPSASGADVKALDEAGRRLMREAGII